MRNFAIAATTSLIALGTANGALADDRCAPALGLGDFAGQTVTISGPWEGNDETLVNSVLDCFEAATGANVEYSGSGEFEQLIVTDIRSGSAPNVAVFPQPGLAADLAAEGGLVPLDEGLASWMAENYGAGQSWVDLGTYANKDGADEFFAFAYKVDVKSLVWFKPENFEDAGYEIPTTMEELMALSDQIVADGGTPWCLGIESGGATGWTATDWMEDIMLRTASPTAYDQWVTNELPFNSDEVKKAMDVFGSIVKNDAYVAGGSGAVASTFFGDSPKGLFTTPPQCYMHRQASFIPSFFPNKGAELEAGEADFFYLPPFASMAELGRPVLGAGTVWAMTKESAATNALFQFLTMPVAHEIWMAQTGFLTPHKGVDSSVYANDSLRKMGEILATADTFRFDASDLMPGKIGAGAFWTEMTAFTQGQDTNTTADNIQKAWDAIK
ncbi:alpha-glucoside ABC transporter substrate-binding protein [Amylibacter ulvae]|uniref:Alpha-glucoside ABC transporter substrate-binding protein n=1 Tax=Paramylibacter ulvae TaxID=1651968 RepID=A0ABQ3D541_9RHOB|nr:ABC transporter substrate-binding protein [Amylibacter ulvae]GHA57323.1 alpha-glucoside ABC transporter substrate-binding protein [Amylibacter ulvae]